MNIRTKNFLISSVVLTDRAKKQYMNPLRMTTVYNHYNFQYDFPTQYISFKSIDK